MATASLTSQDTIKINGRILNDLMDGDCVTITYPNDLMKVKTGKNGNSIYSYDYSGQQAEVTLRVLRGSGDDKYLNGLLNLLKNLTS